VSGTAAEPLRISVVIPSYNSGPQVARLLRCLGLCALDPGDSLEVVVVDDGSADDTAERLAALDLPFPLVNLFLPRTSGSSRAMARNAGIGKATGDLVVLADADQIVGPAFVAAHARFHRLRHDLVVAGPRGDLADGPIDVERLAREFTFDAMPAVLGWDGRDRVMDVFSENFNNLATCWHYAFSCNLSVRREHLLAVGGFDDGFRGWGLEDSELGYRLRRRGLAFAFQRDAVSFQVRREGGVIPDLFVEWRANLEHFVQRHGGVADVAIQQVMCRAFDPADRSLSWLQCAERMEYAARGLAGRVPGPEAYCWVEADDASASDMLAGLPQLAAERDLVVVDESAQAVLAGPVQCITTPRELVYVHRPSPERRQRMLERYRPA
jgi:glycosyltransferase involved in cell wall biosynthesis